MTHPTDLADTAATATHHLAGQTRPGITTLPIADLEHITAALAELAAAMPQTLRQLASHLPADEVTGSSHATACLRHAAAEAAHLATLLDTAHQALGNTAEPETNPRGVKIQPAKGGQFSPGVDTLNRLWKLVNDRFNYLTPTKKPIGFGTDAAGRRKRLYDKPATPLDRLLGAGVLSPAQAAELTAYRDSLNPAQIAREIAALQDTLLRLAKDKTEQLYIAAAPAPLPDIAKGVRIKAS